MKNYTLFDRLDPKSFNGLLAGRLQNHYRLSPAAAQTISQDTVILRNLFGHSTRKEGQVIYYAVKVGEPASKRIRDCHLVGVRLTLIEPPEDLAVLKEHGLARLLRHVMARISKEAYEQGAVLTTEDLSLLLKISPSTVKRYKKEIKASGISLILRGDSADMGPASCHRDPVVKLFLQGYSETEIAQNLHHQLEHVENYLYDFLRVSLLLRDEYQPGIVSRLTRLSKAKVLAIVGLYQKLLGDSYFKPPLEAVLHIYDLNRRLKKTAEGAR
jgi:DNA-binding CsgD family transcriptional regulator